MSGEKVINTDWYRNTLAADLEESGMVETAKDICLMADTMTRCRRPSKVS